MKVVKVAGSGGQLTDPGSGAWKEIAAQPVSLAPVALAAQPTAYIREAWANRPYGTTGSAQVAAASDGERLYVRLEWLDDAKPNAEFQDSAAALFPTAEASPAATLGSADAPVGMWYWENGRAEPLSLTSSGPGVVSKNETDGVAAAALNSSGSWAVVLSGPVSAASKGRIGVAVWNGANDERAGLAAVSQEWLPLELD